MAKVVVHVNSIGVTRRAPAGAAQQRVGGYGPIRGEIRRGAGSLLPWRIDDRQHVLQKEAPRLLRIMRRPHKSAFLSGGGYAVPLDRGGVPRLWGRLRRSAWANTTGRVIRYGWTARHAGAIDAGYTLRTPVSFAVPGRLRRARLPAGHVVKARRFAAATIREWYNDMSKRLARHIASRKPWRRY